LLKRIKTDWPMGIRRGEIYFVDFKPGKSRLAGTMPPERLADVDEALKMVLDLH
jgi:mRNA-degrading endonuclease toxin of MazEF toxin-antitoxin module